MVFNFFLHIDAHIGTIIDTYGLWVYLILFLVIFFETGFVITPFLPGDSLLFAVGAFASIGILSPFTLFILLVLAAILGDAVNYWIGSFIGPKAFKREKGRLFRKEHLEKTQSFYERHGKKTIILVRFMPIVRTFAPFVAGIGKMKYSTFALYNIIGAIMWVGLFVFGGFYFGNVPFVENNFSFVILIIIVISVVPIIVEFFRGKRKNTLHNA